eukprot:TRINITY_DN3202_c0_g1_i1.p1 TRINITY_DN3202_c0_g1~~TRINITY_DN3202_c0_g1_i1.p1  ORF type:complete len:493 (-),score=112.71 TRINITY_DN3202_c0_g1_i1:10-1395(-)
MDAVPPPTVSASQTSGASGMAWGRLLPVYVENVKPLMLTSETVLGRDPSLPAECRCDDKRISKRHVRFFLRLVKEGSANVGAFIEDTSSNGVFLNGRKLRKGKPTQLYTGDEVTLLPPEENLMVWIFQNVAESPRRFSTLVELQMKEKEKEPGSMEIAPELLTSKVTDSPEHFLNVLKVEPSATNISTLRMTLKARTGGGGLQWITNFLDLDGLSALLDVLYANSKKKRKTRLDLDLETEVIGCLKSLMDSEEGLEKFLRTQNAVKKLVQILDTENVPLRTKILKMLSAMCLFSLEGHVAVVDAFNDFKIQKRESSRFETLVSFLTAHNDVEVQGSCVALINAIVNTPDERKDRMHLRGEFMNMGVLTTLELLRSMEDEVLATQLDVFEQEMEADEEEGLMDIDFTKPTDVVGIMQGNLPVEEISQHFLSILHHLLLLPRQEHPKYVPLECEPSPIRATAM